jgi:hypothetical protein
MFLLEPVRFREFDKSRIRWFVQWWELFYNGDVKEYGSRVSIDYFLELNTAGPLSQANITSLLRWKDPRFLTYEGKSNGQKNKRVQRVLDKIDVLNRFRAGSLDEQQFGQDVGTIFPQGLVWQLFLFHIARPFEYPIADQNVFRAYALHTGNAVPKDSHGYRNYVIYFRELTDAFLTSTENVTLQGIDRLRQTKRIDNALIAFGQFLSNYNL